MSTSLNPSALADASIVDPIAQSERIHLVDILRGVALLGILLINIPIFSMAEYSFEAFSNDPGTTNFWVLAFINLLFEGKMRALFSLIFGAGVLLFIAKKERTGQSVTGLFLCRMGWLIVFGLIHAHLLLWIGDILYYYGICGILAYLLRNVKPLYLALGVPLVGVIGFVSGNQFNQNIGRAHLAYEEAQAARRSHTPLTAANEDALTAWAQIEKDLIPNRAEVAAHTQRMKSDYSTVAAKIRPQAFSFETTYLLLQIPDILALMLMGMALYKWGFVSGKWPRKRYIQVMLVGYLVGLPLVGYSLYYSYKNFPNVETFLIHIETHPINWVDWMCPFQRMLLVMAHISTIVLIVQSGKLKVFTSRLAAVGQMAFTNYIMQTIFCTLFFFGYGLNYFAELAYGQLFYVVGAIWGIQLLVSPIWLKYFLFGPLEWLWRSLAYWKIQPMWRGETIGYRPPQVA